MKKGVILILSMLVLASFFVVAQDNSRDSSIGLSAKARLNLDAYEVNSDGNVELKEKTQLSQEESNFLVQSRNELRVRAQAQQECPSECECFGSTVKCDVFDSEKNQTRREMTIYAGNSGNVIVHVREINASTNVTLYHRNGKVYGQFRNNETREIILPDEAKARIELRERVRIENENIGLNEEGKYNLEARKRARLFWTIPVKERVRAQVDAETGEVLRVRSSWWGFLARDVRLDSEAEVDSE
jgi:hypothetical protein